MKKSTCENKFTNFYFNDDMLIFFSFAKNITSQSPTPRPRRGRRKQAMLANGALVKLRLA